MNDHPRKYKVTIEFEADDYDNLVAAAEKALHELRFRSEMERNIGQSFKASDFWSYFIILKYDHEATHDSYIKSVVESRKSEIKSKC